LLFFCRKHLKMPFAFVETALVGCVETHPTKCDRVHLAQESAEGAIANVACVGGDRNANTVSQKKLSFPKSTAILIGNPSNVDIPAARGSDKLEGES
jgi:hypothetical protein